MCVRVSAAIPLRPRGKISLPEEKKSNMCCCLYISLTCSRSVTAPDIAGGRGLGRPGGTASCEMIG